MTDWKYADCYEAVARAQPDAIAQICGDRVYTWRQFDERADRLAADLLEAGLGEQAKVAAYVYNGPEFMETYYAAFKAGLAPVNTNYRYGPDEIAYLFDNADAEAVVFDEAFVPVLEQVRGRVPLVRRWYMIGDAGACPPWAVPYEAVASAERPLGTSGVQGPWGRSTDHLLLLYTGGTTGMPKGVMWRQEDLVTVIGPAGSPIIGIEPCADFAEFEARIGTEPYRSIPACPLIHGTGQFTSLGALASGGSVVTIPDRHFDPAVLLDAAAVHRAEMLVIVGDAFARPILQALQADPARYDLSAVRVIVSSGVMWSQETKAGLLDLLPTAMLVDALSSSEAVGQGISVSVAGQPVETASFQIGPTVGVFTDDGRRVEPGSAEPGLLAVHGSLPIGYYKDEEKTARTFRTYDGVRYSVPGDYALVREDGTLHLLGRGSVCINTGGEKVYPEEVEEVLKQHPTVTDAVCVGVPDERFGEVVVAVVEPAPGPPDEPDAEALIELVRSRLAHFKSPRFVLAVPSIGRSPAGKVDYKRLRTYACAELGR